MSKIDKVTLLNENENYVFVVSENRTYTLTPAIDGVPSQVTIPFSEAEYINGQCNAFRTGMLLFRDNPEKIYEALHIYDYANILKNGDIENILLHPTIEGLQRILDIKDQSTFDRVRAIFVSLKNSNSADLSNRVIKIIDARNDEIRRRQYSTDIILQPRDASNSAPIESENMKKLREQNESMQTQLEEMKSMMAAFMINQNKVDSDKENEDTSEKKAAGRPAKSKEE